MSNNLEFIKTVMKIFEDADSHSDLSWRIRDDGIHFLAICNDLFWWATGDYEDIVPGDEELLLQCLQDLRSVKAGSFNFSPDFLLAEYFSAKKRGMRPQGCIYKNFNADEWKLWDACGPEREYIPGQAFGNTPKPDAPVPFYQEPENDSQANQTS